MKDRGSATAEVAILLPGVVLLLALVLATGSGVVAQVRCVDAARTGARLAARGESAASITSATRASAPSGARVEIVSAAGLVTVSVSAPVVIPLPGAGGLRVTATAVAPIEPSLARAGP